MSKTNITVQMLATVTETFSAEEQPSSPNESSRKLTVDSLNFQQSLNENSVPKVDKPPVYKRIVIGGGATTINLRAAPCLVSPASVVREVDMNLAKVKVVQIKTPPTNANPITIAPGGANPYPLFGAGKDIVVGPGRIETFCFAGTESNLPAVGDTVKNIDISGTLNDVVEIMIGLGT